MEALPPLRAVRSPRLVLLEQSTFLPTHSFTAVGARLHPQRRYRRCRALPQPQAFTPEGVTKQDRLKEQAPDRLRA